MQIINYAERKLKELLINNNALPLTWRNSNNDNASSQLYPSANVITHNVQKLTYLTVTNIISALSKHYFVI